MNYRLIHEDILNFTIPEQLKNSFDIVFSDLPYKFQYGKTIEKKEEHKFNELITKIATDSWILLKDGGRLVIFINDKIFDISYIFTSIGFSRRGPALEYPGRKASFLPKSIGRTQHYGIIYSKGIPSFWNDIQLSNKKTSRYMNKINGIYTVNSINNGESLPLIERQNLLNYNGYRKGKYYHPEAMDEMITTQLISLVGTTKMNLFEFCAGAGTTAMVCRRLGIDYIGIEYNKDNIKCCIDRLKCLVNKEGRYKKSNKLSKKLLNYTKQCINKAKRSINTNNYNIENIKYNEINNK